MTAKTAELWPATALRIRAGDLELRWIDDDLLMELARLAAAGIHAPDAMPFAYPWTRGTPEHVARSVMEYQWSNRAKLGPDELRLELAVLWNGRPVGIQGAGGSDWSVLRSVETGSWLGREYQGRGIGARMRVLMLHGLFAGLGAQEVTSAAYADNVASNAVSRRTGYLPNGTRRVVREGTAQVENRYVMSRERWSELAGSHTLLLGAPVKMEGVEAARAFIDGE